MDFSKLLQQFDTISQKKTYDNNEGDSEYWRPTPDKVGNASAVIRILPDKNIDEIPFQRKFSFAFKDANTNRWYIEDSPSTIGLPDPVSEANRELWETEVEANKEIVRGRKRKETYTVNILVIKDTNNPEAEGGVFKYKMPKKMFAKIVAAAKPDADLGAEPINAFDPMTGADFKLVRTIVSKFPNYDTSTFGAAKPLFGGDKKKIDAVLAKCYDLKADVAPEKFKSYDELKKKFEWVTGVSKSNGAARAQQAAQDPELDALAELAASEKPKATNPAKRVAAVPTPSMPEDDDDAFFSSLVNDD